MQDISEKYVQEASLGYLLTNNKGYRDVAIKMLLKIASFNIWSAQTDLGRSYILSSMAISYMIGFIRS